MHTLNWADLQLAVLLLHSLALGRPIYYLQDNAGISGLQQIVAVVNVHEFNG